MGRGRRSARAAVLGRPIAHSLSPLLHRAAYDALGLTDWRYDAVDLGEDEVAAWLDGLGPEWAGLSVTMPLKRAALELADDATDLAVEVGAANTLVLDGRRRHADNTDVIGIVAALREAGVTSAEGACVLGAGGTAAAALAALRLLGETEPVVLARSRTRASALLAAADRLGVRPVLRPLDEAGRAVAAAVVVSTLPAGAADALDRLPWTAATTLLDVVYHPWPTPLAAAVTAAGAVVVPGSRMLLHQAARQVELMTGRAAPLDAMRAALATATAP